MIQGNGTTRNSTIEVLDVFTTDDAGIASARPADDGNIPAYLEETDFQAHAIQISYNTGDPIGITSNTQ